MWSGSAIGSSTLPPQAGQKIAPGGRGEPQAWQFRASGRRRRKSPIGIRESLSARLRTAGRGVWEAPRGSEGYALSADGGRGGRQPAFGPIRYRGQHRLQRAAPRRESIAHAHRRPRVHEPLHDAFCLQLAQSLGEDSITDAGYAGEQLIEACRSRQQGLDDRPGPAFPNQLDGALKGRAGVEAPTDPGERFYALSLVSETTPPPSFHKIIFRGRWSITRRPARSPRGLDSPER